MRIHQLSLTFATVLGVAATPASAQIIGAKVGWVSSGVEAKVDDIDESTGSRSGFQIGGYYDQNKTIGLRVEGLYTEKGLDGPAVIGTSKTKITYLEVPVMLSVGVPIVRAFAGPNFGLKLGCSGGVVLGSQNMCDQAGTFDFGLRIGARGTIMIFSIEGAYTHGLTNIASGDGVSVKNRTWSLGLGLSVPSVI